MSNIPIIPELEVYVKKLNWYAQEHYPAYKKITAEEWNALFIATMNQGNSQEETLSKIINEILPTNIETINALINKSLIADHTLNNLTIEVSNLKTENIAQETQLNKQENLIEKNRLDIIDLQNISITGLTRIGLLKSQEQPTPEQLTAFVLQHTEPSRDPMKGDYIVWLQNIPDQTNKRFHFYYTEKSIWSEPDQQSEIDKAQNSNYGVIKGSITKDNVNIKIMDGEISEVLVDGKGLGKTLNDIKTGTIAVGNAKKAEIAKYAEGDSEPISITYARKEDTYSKEESNNLFAPKDLVKTLFFNKNNGDWVINTELPVDPVQLETINLGVVNESILLENVSLDLYSLGRRTLTNETTDISKFFLQVEGDTSCNLHVILRTYYIPKSTGVPKLVSVSITNNFELYGNENQLIEIESRYNRLEANQIITVQEGDTLKIEIALEQNEYKITGTAQITFLTYAENPSVYRTAITSYALKHTVLAGFIKVNFNSYGIIESNLVDAFGNQFIKYDIPPEVHGLEPSSDYIVQVFDGTALIYTDTVITTDGHIIITSYKELTTTGHILIADGQRSKT